MKQLMGLNDLVGHTIESIEMSGDDLSLSMTSGDRFTLEPWGECCSTTWIESIDLVDPLLDGTIQSVEELDLPFHGNIGTLHRPCVENVTYYGLKITTNKGVSVIDYRNDSNGYYGGNLDVYLHQNTARS